MENTSDWLPWLVALLTFLAGIVPHITNFFVKLRDQRKEEKTVEVDISQRLVDMSFKIAEGYQEELTIVDKALQGYRQQVGVLMEEIGTQKEVVESQKKKLDENEKQLSDLVAKITKAEADIDRTKLLVKEVVTGARILYNQVVELGGVPMYTPPEENGNG